MPNLRDQGGLAAVARMVQQQRELEASVPAQGVKIANPPAFQPGFLDRKPAKKEKKAASNGESGSGSSRPRRRRYGKRRG